MLDLMNEDTIYSYLNMSILKKRNFAKLLANYDEDLVDKFIQKVSNKSEIEGKKLIAFCKVKCA